MFRYAAAAMSNIRKAGVALAILLLLILLAPVIAIALIWFMIQGIVLRLWFWHAHYSKGRDALLIYSDSPIWKGQIETRILPRLHERAVVLNWSRRRHWRAETPWESWFVKRFAGSREFNPSVLVILPGLRIRKVSFYSAFLDLKHGKPQSLEAAEEEELFRLLPAAA